MGLNLNTSNKPQVINMASYGESAADQTDQFADSFIPENGHDIVTTW